MPDDIPFRARREKRLEIDEALGRHLVGPSHRWFPIGTPDKSTEPVPRFAQSECQETSVIGT